MGGGLKLELGKLFGWSAGLDLSASHVKTDSKREALAVEKASPDIAAGLTQAGFAYRFLPKWGLLGGYQQASLKSPMRLTLANVRHQFSMDENQSHFRLGLEYVFTRNTYLLVSGGLLQVERTSVHRGDSNGGAADPARNAKSDFSQALSQAMVKVRF